MGVIDQRPSEREAVLLQASREELVERIGRTMRQDGSAQPLPPSGAGVQPGRAIGVRGCPGQQGVPAGREPLPV